MSLSSRSWSFRCGRPETTANARVCLALLRIYQGVHLRPDDLDTADVARPFWPVLRRHPQALAQALASCARQTGRGRRSRSSAELQEEVAEWAAQALKPRARVPQEAPAGHILEMIGSAITTDDPAFRALLATIDSDLRAAALRAHPTDTKLRLLAQALSLSAEEAAYLSLCAAVGQGSIGTSPFTVVRGLNRLVQALQAALELPDEYRIRALLRRGSRLLRSGLLDVEHFENGADMEDMLRLSRQGMLLLASRATTMPELAAVVLQPLPAPTDQTLAWPHLQARAELLARLLRNAVAGGSRGINILLHGRPGTGKTQFASQLLHSLGLSGFGVADLDADGDAASRAERLSSLLLSQLFAPAGRSVIVLDEAEDIFQGEYNNPFARALGKRNETKSWMNNLLEGNAHPVVWISNRIDHLDPAYVRRFTYCLEFPETPRGVRRAIAHAHLDVVGCSTELVDTVAADRAVSPALLASAARFAQLAQLQGPTVDAGVRTMLQDMVRAQGGKLRAQVPQRSTRFDLRYLNVASGAAPEAVLQGVMRLGRGRLLLGGPPGTGKTQLAAEMAQRMGRELVYRTASDINAMWFGESERNVARMFEECDPAAEVLFLDEADTLLGSRDGGHRAELAVTAEFLRQVEAFDGVFVCATNFGSRIDAALLRRFEFRLDLRPLSRQQRADLFCECALGWDPASGQPQPPLAPALAARLDRLDLATPGDFANVVRRLQSLQLTPDPAGWLDELETEHASKPGAPRAAVGFV